MNWYPNNLLSATAFFVALVFSASSIAAPQSGPISELEESLAAEEAARIAADALLEGRIDTEESERIDADAVLQKQIDTLFDGIPEKVVSVSGGGTPAENGEAFRLAVEGVASGYLIKLGPGYYYLGTTPVYVPSGVSIVGAGTGSGASTDIYGNVNSEDDGLLNLGGNTELRDMEVRNDTDESGTAIAIRQYNADGSLVGVSVIAQGGGAFGVKVAGSDEGVGYARLFVDTSFSYARTLSEDGVAVAWEADANGTIISWDGGMMGDAWSTGTSAGTAYALRLHNGGRGEFHDAHFRAFGPFHDAVYVQDPSSEPRLFFTRVTDVPFVDPPGAIECSAVYRYTTELDQDCQLP